MDTKKEQHFWHFITALSYVVVLLLMAIYLTAQQKVPNEISVFDFFMLALATFRLTRLLVHDLVFDFVRDLFPENSSGIKLSVHQLLDCPWCTGTWVALAVGFFYFLTPIAWPIILILAIAGFGTLLTILASLMMVALHGK